MANYKRVEFRLTEKQTATAVVRAEKAGMTISALAKKMFLNGDVVVYPPMEDAVFVRNQIGKIGTNINQIARKVNSTSTVTQEDFKQLTVLMKRLERIVDDYLQPQKPVVWR